MNTIFSAGDHITQQFGNKHPLIGGKVYKNYYKRYNSPKGHNGIDIVPAQPGDIVVRTPVMIKEIVKAVNNYNDGFGAYVKALVAGLDGKEYFVYFAHLDMWYDFILTGGPLPALSKIGIMGGSSAGNRYGVFPHLHLGVRGINTPRNNGYNGYINPGVIYG